MPICALMVRARSSARPGGVGEGEAASWRGTAGRADVVLPRAIGSSSKGMPPILDLDAGLATGRSTLSGEEGQEIADLPFAGERVGQGQVGLDRVVVAAAVALAGDVAR
jgi:hypothetical protein